MCGCVDLNTEVVACGDFFRSGPFDESDMNEGLHRMHVHERTMMMN